MVIVVRKGGLAINKNEKIKLGMLWKKIYVRNYSTRKLRSNICLKFMHKIDCLENLGNDKLGITFTLFLLHPL